jgi:hypothetical protein
MMPHVPAHRRTGSADGELCDTFAPSLSRSLRSARCWPSSAG